MLGRSSSDAGTRLHRSKSASTVYRHHPSAPEPLDPLVAQHHAVAAATTAFVRAHGHTVAGRSNKGSSDLSRTKSTSSRKSFASQGSHFPPRESSIRSVHHPKTGQASNAQYQFRAPTVVTEKFPSFYPTPGSDRPLSARRSINFSENMRPNSQSKSHRQSAASSITSQQIRKARSMYYASSVQTGSPIARPPAKYLTTPPPVSISPAPEVLSALMPTRNAASSPLAPPLLPVAVQPGDTIDNTRDKYLQNFQQQRQVKHRPSLFLAPFKKRQERAKKKGRALSAGFSSVCSESRQTPLEPTLEALDDFGVPVQKKEKRSFSNSIKDKFKKVFRRTSNNTTSMAVQQIEASRDYFTYHASPAKVSSKPSDIPSPDDKTLLRARSRASSLERMPSPSARPESRGSIKSRGSNRSLHSESNATHLSSRVTSWSDSSAGNTLTQRDIKRLTVIHEAKDSISSDAGRSISSVSLRRKTVPLSTFTAFKEPMPMQSLIEETSMPVDPKRVFSALMKEIDATKPRSLEPEPADGSPSAKSDVFESSATKELRAMSSRDLRSSASKDCRESVHSVQRPVSHRRTNTAQSKSSSIRSLSRVLRSTIRAVTPMEHKSSPMSGPSDSIRDSGNTARPRTSGSTRSTGSEKHVVIGELANTAFTDRKESDLNKQSPEYSQGPMVVAPSAGQLEQRMKRAQERWKTPLDEYHGPLHHRSHARTFSASQYSKANISQTPITGVGIPALPELEGDSPKETTPQGLPLSGSPQPKPIFSPLSPSVYSRNTDGVSIRPNDSVMSLDKTNDETCHSHDESGSAVIIASHAVKSYVIGTPSSQSKTEPVKSSKDWKAWLSREVSELDNSVEGDITIREGYSPTIPNESPVTQHRREFTQIEDDRTTILARGLMDTRVPSPLRTLSTQSGNLEKGHQSPEISQNQQSPGIKAEAGSETTSASASTPQKVGTVLAFEMDAHRRTTSTLVEPSPAVPKGRHSSSHSYRSTASRSSGTTPKSPMMNERFPYIHTGRRTSMNSARFSRSSRSATDSSSSTKSKGTPGSKVYSDLSEPNPVNWVPRQTPKTNLRESSGSENNKELLKENITPNVPQTKRPGSVHSSTAFMSPLATKENRPMLLLPLASTTIDRNAPPLGQQTIRTENVATPKPVTTKHAQPPALLGSPQRQRMRLSMPPISPNKLTTRPKSAFELRNKYTPSLASSAGNAQLGGAPKDDPKKKKADRCVTRTPDPPRMPASGYSSGIDHGTLSMLIESPWLVSGPLTSPRSSMDPGERSRVRPKPHLKHSSSAFALHREPSPGAEEKHINAVLDERPLSRRSNVTSMGSVCGDDRGSATGRVTPGQRLAEKFLRERNVPRAGSEDTPAFL